MRMLTISVIASVGFDPNEVNKQFASQFISKAPRRSLVQPHERRVNHKAALHAQVQCRLECLQGIVATVGIAGEICFTHTPNEMFDTSSVGKRSSNCQKQDIATGNESVWQAVGLHFDLNVTCKSGFTNVSNQTKVNDAVISKATPPIWERFP